VISFNPATSSNCCKKINRNNELPVAKITLSILADSDKKIAILDFDFKIIAALKTLCDADVVWWCLAGVQPAEEGRRQEDEAREGTSSRPAVCGVREASVLQRQRSRPYHQPADCKHTYFILMIAVSVFSRAVEQLHCVSKKQPNFYTV